jgi:hypothetical protein
MPRPQNTTDPDQIAEQEKFLKKKQQVFKADMFYLLGRPEFHRFLAHMWEDDAFPPRGGCNFYPSGSDQYYRAGRASAGAYLEALVNEHGNDATWLAIRRVNENLKKEKDNA